MPLLQYLGWLLRQVPPAEAVARLQLAVRKRFSRNWRPRIPAVLKTRPVFGSLADEDALRRAFESAGLVGDCVEEAESILAGDFTLFGGLIHHADGGIPDWLAALPEGARWSEGFSFDIDLSGNDGRDIRFTWELSRAGDLTALARVWYLAREGRYLRRLEELLSSWIKSNPFLCGPNWISALEVALRAISWTFIDDATGVGQTAEDFDSVLFRHGLYIERFISKGLNPNNHLIGEAAGLFVLSGKFVANDAGRRWRAYARRILEREIVRQTYPSGASREQSAGYHRFVTGLFALCLAVARRGEFSPVYKRRLEAMYAYLAAIARPDGSFPRIGDSDEAVALRLSRPSAGYLAPDLALGAALFPYAGFAATPGTSPEALWLLGPRPACTAGAGKPAAANGEVGAPVAATAQSVSLPGTGLVVLRSGGGRIQVEFDRGPQGYRPVSSHGHCDALSVTLWRNGARLIDPGTYRYNGEKTWRDAFRSSAFHNTVTVDGAPQARPATPFRWLTLADAKADGHFFSDDFDWAAGVLERGRGRPWRHEREVIRAGSGLVILIDRISQPGRHLAEACFHLGDAAVSSLNAHGARVKYPDGEVMPLFAVVPEARFEVVAPCEVPPAAWRSPSYGVRKPSAVIAGRADFQAQALLPWVMCFGEAHVEFLKPSVGEAMAVVITNETGRFIFVCMPRANVVHIQDLRFVGRWGLFKYEGERLVRAWAADAWALEANGRRLFTRFDGKGVGLIHDALS